MDDRGALFNLNIKETMNRWALDANKYYSEPGKLETLGKTTVKYLLEGYSQKPKCLFVISQKMLRGPLNRAKHSKMPTACKEFWEQCDFVSTEKIKFSGLEKSRNFVTQYT